MAIKEVWGFDPDEVMRSQKAFVLPERKQIETEDEAEMLDVECARLPFGADAQVYELKRLFRL